MLNLQPDANSSLDCRTGGDSLHLVIPVRSHILRNWGQPSGCPFFFVLICSRFVLFFGYISGSCSE
jgi:hypothetical protein